MRRLRKTLGVPVLKLPAGNLLNVVLALKKHEYDRDGFRDAVLEIFPGKEEKSVFRGMAIPSLRTLGLLVGFELETHLSSDGALVAADHDPKAPKTNEPMRLLLREIEVERGLHSAWTSENLSIAAIRDAFARVDSDDDKSSPKGDFLGRVNRWVNYLEYFGIIFKEGNRLRRNVPILPASFQYSESVIAAFAEELHASYRRLIRAEVGEPVVAFEDLRRELALALWRSKQLVVMKRDFDRILSECLTKESVDIHLHRSMGADEGLFTFREVSYQSVSMKE